MKTLANLQEMQSEAFADRVAEMNALARRLGLREYTTWSKIWEYPWIESRVESLIAPGARILDLGSELSPVPWRWALRGARVWMVETNAAHTEMWEAARARLVAEGELPGEYAIQWEIVSDEKLPFDDCMFDLVSSFSVIEHMPNKRRAVDEAVRVLRPGGSLAVSFDICEAELGMSFPEWNGEPLSLAEFDALLWRHPELAPWEPGAQWNLEDINDFLAWHRSTAEHHNYVVGAAVFNRRKDLVATATRLATTLAEALADTQQSLAAIDGALDDIGRRNLVRDEAIGALQAEVHRHKDALGEMTRANQRRDEAIAQLTQSTNQLNALRDATEQRIAVLERQAQETARHAADGLAQVRQIREALEDLRGRSLRVPYFLAAWWRRLRGRSSAARGAADEAGES